jgi:quercetin dioxygenase-like cupin family protein
MKVHEKSDLKKFPIFEGISGRIVFSSKKVMFLLVEIGPGEIVPEHSHPHEQMGICLKGKAEFKSEGFKAIVEKGMFYWIEPGEKHTVTPLTNETCLFLDVFNPPRQDYIDKSRKT